MSRGSGPASYPAKPLVSFRTYRQLSGWNPPPLMIRAFRAHCQQETFAEPPHNRRSRPPVSVVGSSLDDGLCPIPVIVRRHPDRLRWVATCPWHPGFPASDPSTDLQVRCHGSERDGRDAPETDIASAPQVARSSNARNGVAVLRLVCQRQALTHYPDRRRAQKPAAIRAQ